MNSTRPLDVISAEQDTAFKRAMVAAMSGDEDAKARASADIRRLGEEYRTAAGGNQ